MKLGTFSSTTTVVSLAASLATLVLLGLASPALAQSTYDFEALSIEDFDLVGQDGWAPTLAGNPGLFVGGGAGSNDSVVVDSSFGFAAVAGRPFDGTFGHPPLIGSETSVLFEVDVRAQWSTGVNSFGGIAPWADLAPDSRVAYASEIGPLFGFTHNFDVNVPNFYLGASAGGATFAVAAVPISVDQGDWLRIRLWMNLSANGGNGSGELLYRNLTDGDVQFRPTGISNFDLRLLGGPSPTTWNGVVVRIDNTGQLDNVTVPEPSCGIGLLIGGGLLTAMVRRPSRGRISTRSANGRRAARAQSMGGGSQAIARDDGRSGE